MSKSNRVARVSAVNPTIGLRRCLIASAILFTCNALALEAVDEPAKSTTGSTELEGVTVLGSRAKGHTEADTPAPVDVIRADVIQSVGSFEIGRILQMLEPSANFSTTFLSDGQDAIRPATLRGLGPDQVLVLINGKRQHQQALVNTDVAVGLGSAGTDLNVIPVSAIERIEVLRDGAAAQYGSDAIAGVINIVLKKQTKETQVFFEGGKTSKGDGGVLGAGLNTGFAFGDGGYTNVTLEWHDREATNRAGPDYADTNPPRKTLFLGDPAVKEAYLWLNGGLPIGPGELYWFGGASQREGEGHGFFRAAGDPRAVPAVYPDGFTPQNLTTIRDQTAAIGYRGKFGNEWEYDSSLIYGRSAFNYHEGNTINVSYWYEPKPSGGIYAESPNYFYAGSLENKERTFNLDFHGPWNWGLFSSPLYLATGFEYRRDEFRIIAGEPGSYQYGRTNNPNIPILASDGSLAPPGSQGYPGFSPATAVDAGRHNEAVYLDAEQTIADKLLIGGAARYEKYSDFGNTTTGKLTGRYDFNDAFAIRSTLSTGFRAPGVQQENYSQISTTFNTQGVLVDTLIPRQQSAVTQALGIAPLKQEESKNASFGVVMKPLENLSVTLDYYRIDIKNRIVFSGLVTPEDPSACATATGCPIRNALAPYPSVGQAAFFTNAVNTSTKGIDLVADYAFTLDNSAKLDFGVASNYGTTRVTKRNTSSNILSPDVIFDATQVTLIERGQPHLHHVVSSSVNYDKWFASLRFNYFGSVQGQSYTPGQIQTWRGKWLTDLDLRYSITPKMSISIGANNAFNVQPDRWTVPQALTDWVPYGFTRCYETCPFGLNGAYYYTRFDFAF
jgi:iron complex outermembrane receptor protein